MIAGTANFCCLTHHKRVYRLYRKEGLAMRIRQRRLSIPPAIRLPPVSLLCDPALPA